MGLKGGHEGRTTGEMIHKMLNSPSSDNPVVMGSAVKASDKQMVYCTDDVESLYKSKLYMKRMLEGKTTYARELTAFYDGDKILQFKDSLVAEGFNVFEFGEYRKFIVHVEREIIVNFSIDSNKIYLYLVGSPADVAELEARTHELLETFTSHIEWYYSSGGSLQSETLPIRYNRLPVQEMYPFLGEKTIDQYYQEYIDSDAAVLLMMGPPGTGKTTFLKGLLNYSKQSACVSYNIEMLSDDSVFIKFLTGDMKFMIVEDSDAFLQKRTDGNTMMHRFLNVSDGLVTIKGKKLIFTSNLPNLADVDEALTRKGRCYDILQFDTLTRPQAQKLADKFDVELGDGSEFTIAEVLAQGPKREEKKRFGF